MCLQTTMADAQLAISVWIQKSHPQTHSLEQSWGRQKCRRRLIIYTHKQHTHLTAATTPFPEINRWLSPVFCCTLFVKPGRDESLSVYFYTRGYYLKRSAESPSWFTRRSRSKPSTRLTDSLDCFLNLFYYAQFYSLWNC